MTMPKIDSNTVASVIVAVIALVLLWMGYQHFFGNEPANLPNGAISAAEYEKLKDEDKAKWKKDGANAWYIPA